MAYFLGIKQYGKYKPITLLDENNEKIPDKLLDILRFTTKFITIEDLKEYLTNKGSIDNFSVELCYLISKGNKNNRHYEVIALGDTVYLNYASEFLDLAHMKQYLYDNAHIEKFLDHLYTFYLRKFGVLGMAISRFENKAYDYEQMNSWLDTLMCMNFSMPFKDYLGRIKSFINDVGVEKGNKYISVTKEEDMYYKSLIADLNHILSDDDGDIRRFVNFFRARCNYPDIPSIRYIEKISSIANYTKLTGVNVIETYEEREDLHTYIDKFIASLLYTYDPSTHDYKKVNGSYKVNERNFCDLAMFLATYDDYVTSYEYPGITYHEEKTPEYYPSEDEYDKEEFLEPEDFTRQNIDYREFGYHLHPGDNKDNW